MDKWEREEYERISRNLAAGKEFCDKHGIDQLEALGLNSNKDILHED